jgi:hypothetical protein
MTQNLIRSTVPLFTVAESLNSATPPELFLLSVSVHRQILFLPPAVIAGSNGLIRHSLRLTNIDRVACWARSWHWSSSNKDTVASFFVLVVFYFPFFRSSSYATLHKSTFLIHILLKLLQVPADVVCLNSSRDPNCMPTILSMLTVL